MTPRPVIQIFKSEILKNKNVLSILERSEKNNKMEIFTYQSERWDSPSNTRSNYQSNKIPDMYDFEGHWSADFCALYDPSIFSILKATFDWGKDHKFDAQLHPFTFPWSGYLCTIDSIKSVKAEMVREVVDSHSPAPSKKSKIFNEFLEKKAELYDVLIKSTSDADILEYMESEDDKYYQVSEIMWINMEDPASFIINEKEVPFDLKDGWSNSKCAELIGHWLSKMNIYCGPVKIVHYPNPCYND